MVSDVLLACPSINSGTAVIFRGATVKYAWKNLTRTTPLTNQFSIAETQMAGFENPKIIVTGYIDTNKYPAIAVTQPYLIQFASLAYDNTAATTILFSVSTGTSNVYLRNWDNSSNAIQVVIENFSVDIDAGDSNYGHLWRYTMTLVETA